MNPEKISAAEPSRSKPRFEVSIKQHMLSYLSYYPVFLLSLGIAFVASFLYLRYAAPKYNVSASLLIKDDKATSGGLSKEFADLMLFDNNNNLDNEIEILQSRTLIQRVVTSLDLQTHYWAMGKIRTSNIYGENPMRLEIVKWRDSNRVDPVSFKVTILNDQQFQLNENKTPLSFGQYFETSLGEFRFLKNEVPFRNRATDKFSIVHVSMDDAIDQVKSELKIRPVNTRSRVLVLSQLTENSKLGMDIINQLMTEYNKATIEDKNQIAQSTYNFIDKRLHLLAVELGDVEKELKQYKMDNEVYDITGQTSLAFSKLTDLDKAQSDANIKLAICKMLEEYISDKANIYNKVPGTLGIEDPTLLAASTLYNELVLEREKKIKETTPNNFYVKEIELKISRAREAFLETIRNIKRTFELMATDLAGQKARYNSEVKAVPQKERGLREIARQQGIKENLYLYLLQKREETAITLASTISNSRVVDFAFRPTLPISPIHKNIYLIGLALGLLVPLLFIYLRELLNDKVESVEDINRVIDVPIIGSVSHSTENQMLVVGQHSRKVISEQFRIIRTNLQYFTQQSRQNIVLVTSTFSGEGKSFVSTNLAAVIALTGKKTIVLEFDIRKPKVASGFNIISKKGISNFLIGGAQIDEIIFPVPDVPNLFVIPCGPIPPNPAEILLSDKLNALFEEVKSRFDMILIDSAPLGMVSDAFELAKYANNTVYVVRQRYTQKNQLKVIHQIYQEKRLPALSILLNDVKLKGVGAYGYHMYGGYGYGYGYGAGSSYLETESNGSANGKKHKRSIFEKFK